jgi:NAD(P)H dehydrogenase (quinone)
MAKVAVIYYSSTGSVHRLAQAIGEGAASQGAEVRVKHVPELAPTEAIASNPEWQAHYDTIKGGEFATLDDLAWADAYVLGTPTRFGNVTSQLKQFIDTAGGLWMEGALAGKVASSFTSAMNAHGGQESTILALNNVFYHWGSVIVPPGYTDPRVFAGGGNPYGISSSGAPTDAEIAAAEHQGERVAQVAAKLRG